MKKGRFRDGQVVGILEQHEAFPAGKILSLSILDRVTLRDPARATTEGKSCRSSFARRLEEVLAQVQYRASRSNADRSSCGE
jgi:hypothetical protein